MPDTHATVTIYIDHDEGPLLPRLVKHERGTVSVTINGPGILNSVYLSGPISPLIAHLTAVIDVLVHEQEKRAEAEAVLA